MANITFNASKDEITLLKRACAAKGQTMGEAYREYMLGVIRYDSSEADLRDELEYVVRKPVSEHAELLAAYPPQDRAPRQALLRRMLAERAQRRAELQAELSKL